MKDKNIFKYVYYRGNKKIGVLNREHICVNYDVDEVETSEIITEIPPHTYCLPNNKNVREG